MPSRHPTAHASSASQREIELKLGLTERQAPAVAAELDAHGPVVTTLLQAHYFDTADGLLARAGLSLRLRLEGERWVQTLKASGAVAQLDRSEHEVPLEALPRGKRPQLDPARHAGSEAGQALAAVLADAPQARLVKRYGTVVVRRSSQVRIGTSLIEASLDLGHVEAGARRLPLCELELELQHGSVKALAQLARHWLLRHGLWLSAETKAERGRRLLHGEAQPAAVSARPPQLRARMSPETLLQALMAS
ncbi:MAG TPA: CYTH domain-containing protein, partial [Rhizobacter sp.]|nr:CYTH domain-containing protein [Rhizobacter sp.]